MSAADGFACITEAAALDGLCRQMRAAAWIAVDTEFMRESTYYPKPCLLQVSTPAVTACVDPLLLPDLAPLLDILYDPAIEKVFHSGRQDLEIFYQLRGVLPAPVFDTQLAAPLLGHAEQIGYAALVEAVLGTRLHKGHTRTDWSRRPLTPAQIRYAGEDVLYLGRLYERMKTDLAALGRLEWLAADFVKMVDVNGYRNAPRDAWKRLRGLDRLNGAQLAAVQRLAAWREETAQAADRPRGWVLNDEVLVAIAAMLPGDEEDLDRVRGLPEGVRRKHGTRLLEMIAEARAAPAAVRRDRRVERDLSPEEEALVDAMMAVLRLTAAEHRLHPSALASRRDLEHWVAGAPGAGIKEGWRGVIVGKVLGAFRDGRSRLRVGAGRLMVETT